MNYTKISFLRATDATNEMQLDAFTRLQEQRKNNDEEERIASVYECRYVLDVIKLLPFQTA